MAHLDTDPLSLFDPAKGHPAAAGFAFLDRQPEKKEEEEVRKEREEEKDEGGEEGDAENGDEQADEDGIQTSPQGETMGKCHLLRQTERQMANILHTNKQTNMLM